MEDDCGEIMDTDVDNKASDSKHYEESEINDIGKVEKEEKAKGKKRPYGNVQRHTRREKRRKKRAG